MVEVRNIKIGRYRATGIRIKTENTCVLMIKARKGFLACRYLDVKIADMVNDAAVIVKGVNNFGEMLKAPVFKLSKRARSLGIKKGFSGKEALEKLY